MVTGKTLELAMRIKADFESGLKALDDLTNSLQETGAAAKAADQSLDAATSTTTHVAAAEQKATAAAQAHAAALRTVSLTSGQYQQAMRMLPMQLTDVVTSLSSGMPAWMVAIQQGGQIRDSFGGIGAAARGVISAINPLTAAIAAITAAGVGMVAAYEAANGEQQAFNETLILTGNYAGLTAGQLAAMARAMDGLDGITQGGATEALNAVASRGQFAGEQIELIATAAEKMKDATGKSIDDTVDEFEKLARKPIETLIELNRNQHFLSQGQLEQIRILKEQQGEQAAGTAAVRLYADVLDERAGQIIGNLDGIERSWRNVKKAAAETVDGVIGFFRPQDDEQQVKALTQRIAYLRDTLASGFEPGPDTEEKIKALSAELERLTGKQKAAAEAAKSTVDSAAEAARQAAADSFVKSSESQLQSLQKLSDVERARQLMQQQGIEVTSSLGQRMLSAAEATDRQRTANEAATEAERRATQARREAEQATKTAARQAEQLAKQQETYLAGLERQAATFGKSTTEVRTYDLAERRLAGALKARADAALATLAAQEQLRQATADGKQLADIQVQLLSGQGRNSEASALQFEQQYGELRKRLQARGDVQGQGLLTSLLGVQQAKAQMDELDRQLNATFAEQSRREQSIQAQQQAGLISELGARQQLGDLHKATAAQVEALLPRMQALADATGDPAAQERLKDMKARLAELKLQADDLTNALKTGLQDGLQNALEGLASGTMNLREAATSFVQGIAQSMAQLASQKIATSAADGLSALFGGGQQNPATMAAQQIAAIQQVSMAQQAANTAMATSSVASANVAAAGQATAAAATTTAWTPAALTASIGSFGAAAAIGLAALVAALAFKAFKEGGHVTGPGSGTSDSIPARLSNNEFVVRAAVVTQPGMLQKLHDINRHGRAALDASAVAYHSTGGLAGVPAPSYPEPRLPNGGQPAEPSTNLSTTLKNNLALYLVDDPDRIREAVYKGAGQDAFAVMLSRDPMKYRQILNI